MIRKDFTPTEIVTTTANIRIRKARRWKRMIDEDEDSEDKDEERVRGS